jgi:hypothetical protein
VITGNVTNCSIIDVVKVMSLWELTDRKYVKLQGVIKSLTLGQNFQRYQKILVIMGWKCPTKKLWFKLISCFFGVYFLVSFSLLLNRKYLKMNKIIVLAALLSVAVALTIPDLKECALRK